MTNPNQPQYQPGQIVNGHQLVQREDGTFDWVPLTVLAQPAAPTPPVKPGGWIAGLPRWVKITAPIVGGLLLISIIGNGIAGDRAEETAAMKPTVSVPDSTPKAKPAEPEVEKTTVPDVTGATTAEAVAVLRAAGLTVDDPADGSLIVTMTTPGKGGIVEVGAKVILTAEPPKPKYTLAQENAIEEGRSYLAYSGFSRSGLIGQLEYEGYSTEDATFAVDTINPDWNAECAEEAKSYMEYSSFSRDGLYGQLEYEGYTPDQIAAGLAAVGY